MASLHPEKDKEQILEDSLVDPVEFVQRVLYHRTWKTQERILRSVRDFPLTVAKACHSSSKTFSAAEATLWWISRWDDGVVLTTSPTGRQVESLLWGELRKTLRQENPKPLISYPDSNLAAIKLKEGNFAMGFSTSAENAGVNIQGFKGSHLLLILDEAPGLEGPLFEALEGMRAGGDVHVLMLGNPTIPGGPLYDAFNRDKDRWNAITIDAFDTPNFEGFTLEMLKELPRGLKKEDHPLFAYNPWPQLVQRYWAYEMYWTYGENSPVWQARVRGQFPEQAADALFPILWLNRARGFVEAQEAPLEFIIGIDVAGSNSGDETAVCVRRGRKIVATKTWQIPDPRKEVVEFLLPYREHHRVVNCDSTGIGHYFALHLKDHGFRVHFINFGAKATNADVDDDHAIQFANRKAEIYWRTREKLEHDEIRGLTEEMILQATPISYWLDGPRRVAVESKEDLKKRGIDSPDLWEAVCLAFGCGTFEVAPLRSGTPLSANQGQVMCPLGEDQMRARGRTSGGEIVKSRRWGAGA